MTLDIVPQYSVPDSLLNLGEPLPPQHKRLPSPRNPHLLSRDLCHHISEELLVIQINVGQSRNDNGITGYCVDRVQPPTPTDSHDHNVQLQLLEYRHRSAQQDLETWAPSS